MTLDCSNTNRGGPGRFRYEADNPDNQFCYFNSVNDEQGYIKFVSKRIRSLGFENKFDFKIVEVKSKPNKNISFDATNKLQELNKDNDTETNRSSETFRTGTTKTLSGFSGRGIKKSVNEYSTRSVSRNNEIVRKRAKPWYLLKR